jgi:hypothetical protein
MSNAMWTGLGEVPAAWVGLQWISDPTASGCTAAPYYHSANPHWHGTNTGYASAIGLSSTPSVFPGQPPNTTVWNRGVFSWRNNNADPTYFPGATTATAPTANTTTDCSPTGAVPSLVCRPSVLTHSPDSFSSTSHFPFFQEFLGLDDISYQNLLDKPDSCGGTQATCSNVIGSTPPLGFTYIKMASLSDEFQINNVASPGTNDFGLIYVYGSLRIASNFTFKGVIFVDGSLHVSGEPTILGAVIVRGATQVTAGTGNITLLYSREAAKRGIQAAHPWGILTWEDTAIQGSAYTE